jgi:hypothetical protein
MFRGSKTCLLELEHETCLEAIKIWDKSKGPDAGRNPGVRDVLGLTRPKSLLGSYFSPALPLFKSEAIPFD